MVTTAVTEPSRLSEPDDDERPGWVGQWVRRDPVRAVAALLIAIQVLWRTQVGSGGFMSNDDFYLAMRSKELGLTFDYLFEHFNGHLLPVQKLYIYYVTEWFDYTYWPYLTAMIVGQTILSIVFYRLLRLLIPSSWAVIAALCVFLFSPLNLESTTWWVFGMFMLPVQLAMVWAMGAQVKFARTRRKRHLVSLVAALVFGLGFDQKALLILPLLFVFTACLLVKGSPGRSILRTQLRYWQSWVALIIPAAAYLVLYQSYAISSAVREPESINQVTTFFKQFFGHTLFPGLLGGPWTWLSGTNVPLSTPTPVLQTIAWSICLGFVVFTTWRRPAAGRAWVLFFAYALIASGLIAASRMGAPLSWLAGMVTRYTSDVVVIAALCVGVAIAGLRDFPDRRPPRRVPWLETTAPGRLVAVIAGSVGLVVLAYGTIMTTSAYERAWSDQPGRTFYETARAELAKAPAGTVFFDMPVGPAVIAPFSFPYNMQTRFFSVLEEAGPVFVTGAESPMVFTGEGHIKPAYVKPLRQNQPGKEADCGYEVPGGQTVSVPLNAPMFDWGYTARVFYDSDRETPVTIRFGSGKAVEFTARPGKHHYFFLLGGGGQTVQISAAAPGARLCVNELVVGELMPWLL